MRFDLRVGRGLEVLVADVRGKMNAAIVEQHLIRDGGDDVSRRIGDEPAQQLLPEHVVRRYRPAAGSSASARPGVASTAVRPRP